MNCIQKLFYVISLHCEMNLKEFIEIFFYISEKLAIKSFKNLVSIYFN